MLLNIVLLINKANIALTTNYFNDANQINIDDTNYKYWYSRYL